MRWVFGVLAVLGLVWSCAGTQAVQGGRGSGAAVGTGGDQAVSGTRVEPAGTDGPAAGGSLERKLGPEFLAVLGRPGRVSVQGVNPDVRAAGEPRVAGFLLTGTVRELGAEELGRLSAALTDPASYDFALAKRGLLFPEACFVFEAQAGGQERRYAVLFDRTRKELWFCDRDKVLLVEDCDAIVELLLGLSGLAAAGGGA